MPNYCYNRLYAPKQFIDNYVTLKGDFDFNKIIPMPEDYEGLESSTDVYASVYRYIINALHDEELWKRIAKDNGLLSEAYKSENPYFSRYNEEVAKKAISNYHKYGALTWYQWCTKNWGTKWNALDTQIIALNGRDECIEFATAWTEPTGVIKALRAINPNFKWLYREEEDEEWTEA